jgi:hypothetical protein
MANYYVLVSTHKENERDSYYVDTQLRDLKLSIGWGDINPINKSQPEIKRIIEDFYPDFKGTVNPDNGAKSLSIFTNLKPGDIVFIRGIAKIIDVVVITDQAFFDKIGHYPDDYYLKISFIPLFSNKQSIIKTANIPSTIYDEVLYEGGRSLVIRELSEDTARQLLKAMTINL